MGWNLLLKICCYSSPSLLIPLFNVLAQNGYGDVMQGFPSLLERQIAVLTDACRMAPVQYRDAYVGTYAILDPADYPAADPLYWNLQLNQSARDHAIDMGDTCGILQHPSCNGTSWDVRIKSFYKTSSWIGENIAYSNTNPFSTLNQWLLDMQTNNQPAGDNTWVKNATTGDSSRADGHRWNIMFTTYNEFGTGYAYGDKAGSKLHNFWVQDFGGGKSAYTNPIVAGSHFFITSGNITFLADFFDPSAKPPTEASMTLAGQKSAMTLLMGTPSRGAYQLVLARASTCRAYYFSFIDGNGKTRRYPEDGALVTSGEGSCTQEYVQAESLLVGKIPRQFTENNGFIKSKIDRSSLTIIINDRRYVPQRSAIIDCRGRTLLLRKWEGPSLDRTIPAEGALPLNVPLNRPLPSGLYFVVHCFSMGNSIIEKVAVLLH
jgi:Uncharacterized protein with SCP/PR1 domains